MKENNHHLYFLIFIFFFSCFLLISNGRYGGDGLENYLTAQSLVLDGDLAIYDRPFQVNEMNYSPRGYTDSQGKVYSTFGIGMPLLLVPLYFIGHLISKIIPIVPGDYITQFFVSCANPIIIALTALVMFIFLIRLGFKRRTSFLTILCYAFCTMALNYSRSGFSEPAVGFLILSALLSLFIYEEKGFIGYALLAGILIGYSMLIKRNSFLYLPIFFLYMIYRSFYVKPLKRRILFWGAAVIPLTIFVLLSFYFRRLIGGIDIPGIKTGGMDEIVRQGTTYGGGLIKALYYYFFSPGKGYFFYNIILVLSLFGIKPMLRRNKMVSVYLIISIITPLLFYAYRFTRGTLFSWGPRYLYPTIPILCIFLADFIEEAKKLPGKVLLFFFAVTSFLIQLPPLFISFTKYIYFVKEKLGLEEYMINFMPELSPIRGSWALFTSAIHRLATGISLDFSYNPDPLFIEKITKSLSGYDMPDIWWVHLANLQPSLTILAALAPLALITVAVFSLARIKAKL